MVAGTAGVSGRITVAGDGPYRTVADRLPDVGVLMFDRELRYKLVTGAALHALWRPDELLGRTVFELFPAEQAEMVAGHYRAALAGEPRYFEVQGLREPSRRWSVDAVPVQGPDGVIRSGIAFCRDITDQRRADEELRESRRRLAEAQRIAKIGSWEWEIPTGEVTASDELYRILGLTPGTPMDIETGTRFVHPDDLPLLREVIGRVTSDPSPYEVEHRVVDPDGTVRTVRVRGEGICDGTGRVVRVVGTDQDITETKRAEEQRQQLLARLYQALEGQHQQLAADLHDSHVQSLAAIGLKLDCARLLVEADPVRVRGLLEDLRADLAGEMAALRRTIGALRPLVLDQRGLVAALRDLAAGTRDRAGLAACVVNAELSGQRLDPMVETVLFRVAQQALTNAEQHAGACRVRIGLRRSGSWTVLSVADDGCGFDPGGAAAPAGSGGFGLTSMRERVQAVGGQFEVDTGPGRGTRIEVSVPDPG
jgi:PAS domain S-box-containing protein